MNTFNNTGLNGIFSNWLKSAFSWAIGAAGSYANGSTLGIFSPLIDRMSKTLISAFDGVGWDLWKSNQGLQEPTYDEKPILDAFAIKITAFFVNTLASLEATLSGSNPNIAIVNNAMAKMSIVKEYFLYNEIVGLSANAIQLRSQLIEELLTPIEELITQKLGSTQLVTINVLANQNDYNGLFSNSVEGQLYQCLQFKKTNNQASAGVGITKDTADLESIFDNNFNATVHNPISVTSPVNQNPVQTLETPTLDKTFKYVSYGLIAVTALGVVTSFFKKKQQ